jgi:hypothetical protein
LEIELKGIMNRHIRWLVYAVVAIWALAGTLIIYLLSG